MASMRRIDPTGSAFRRESRPGPTAGALIPWGIRAALLAMVLAGMALWSTAAYADGEEASEPLWSADMTVVEYTTVSIGAASADLFSNVGGSGDLQIKSLWSHKPDRDLRLAFAGEVPDLSGHTLQVGVLSLEFPSGGSGDSSFKWNDVDVDWEDGQLVRVRIVLTSEVVAPETNTPATGVPAIFGTAQVAETLSADTSDIADEDGLDSVSYHYQWMRNDVHIQGATKSTYTLTEDDRGKTIKLKVSFIDDKENSEILTSAATEKVSEGPEFLVSNLRVNVFTGIMRPLNPARSGFAQAFTTGANTGGYALGSVSIFVSHFADGSTVEDHLKVTINSATGGGEPGDALCTLTIPSSFSTPGVIAFAAPTGTSSCPQLAVETTYFVVIEWLNPSGTDSFALIPQTYGTEERPATDEDPGGAEGWSIADKGYYLSVSSDARTWTEYDETASFKIRLNASDATANSPATGLPTITGTAQVGETLTAGTSAIEDEDGLENVSYSYQWLADDTDIDGATESTYALTTNEQGKTIKVKVTFTDDANNEETLTSAATDAVAAKANTAATGLPTITGTAKVGETLTADTSAIEDEDGLDDVSYSYQWLADDTDIDGATESTYALTTNEQGKTIKVKVTFADDAENEETLTSEATAAVAAKANTAATGLPTITGTAQVGETLTADTSAIEDEDGLENVSYSYQWLADDTDIDGATSSTYELTTNEQGKTIKVKVTFADDAENEETLTSEATAAVAAKANTAATGLPTITGTAQVGETLTADTSAIEDEDGLENVSYSYQWLADDTDIDGATSSTYELTTNEQGKTIKVKVTFADDAENEETLTSAATAAVAAKDNTAATGLPTITGTAKVGETLTADTSAIEDEDGLDDVSYSYQWLADDTDIDGATESTYALTTNEQGKTIKVKVTFADDAENEETLTSEATAAVAAKANTAATGLPTITGTAQVGETLTADTSAIEDEDGLENVSYSYQWLADDTDIAGATGSTYELTSSEEGKTIKVKVTFTDDSNNEESLTSEATVAVAAAPIPLTVSVTVSAPASHDGSSEFTFEIEFSEEFGLSYRTLKFDAFNVTGGSVERAQRTDKPSNIPWRITIKPQGNGDVTIVLPVTTDCNADGAICTGDGRKLSNSLSITVPGPGQ